MSTCAALVKSTMESLQHIDYPRVHLKVSKIEIIQWYYSVSYHREFFHLYLSMKDCFVPIGPGIAHSCTVKVLVPCLASSGKSMTLLRYVTCQTLIFHASQLRKDDFLVK